MAGCATEQSSVVTDSSLTGQSTDVEMAANAAEPGLERSLLRPNGSVANAADSGVDPGMLLQPRQRQLENHLQFNNRWLA